MQCLQNLCKMLWDNNKDDPDFQSVIDLEEEEKEVKEEDVDVGEKFVENNDDTQLNILLIYLCNVYLFI